MAKHPILYQVAQDILAGLEDNFRCDKPVVVYCGVHTSLGFFRFLKGYKIGIQTEQLMSHDGKTLWKQKSVLPSILKTFRLMDSVVEINVSNRPVFEQSSIDQTKLIYGAHIFPEHPPSHVPGKGHFAFFGSLSSDRRKSVLERMDKSNVKVLKRTFGQALSKALQPCRGVLNLHYDEGVYTEYPRLLTALLAGKVVASEQLSNEFIPGVHYFNIDAIPPDASEDGKVFKAFAEMLCETYSFATLLRRLVPCSEPGC